MGKKGEKLRILIITGLSGAGKTSVINCLEDLGYYCVDNLPPVLLTKFVELSLQSESNLEKVALVIDVRGGEFFCDLSYALGELERAGLAYEILFLTASDEVLICRFKETRRRHPLADEWRLQDAIIAERTMLEELLGKANVIIDTSKITPKELKEKLIGLYSERHSGGFCLNILSFGYKHGIPLDSDIIMDVRFLPNPFYDPVMKNMTGQDEEVWNYVLNFSVTRIFCDRFLDLLKYLIPYYMKEGKTNLAVAIGCTGGQHRSVVLADFFGNQLKQMGYIVISKHRDISKYRLED